MTVYSMRIDEVLALVESGVGLSHEEALVLVAELDTLNYFVQAQAAIHSAFVVGVSDMAYSLAGTVLSRAGRTDVKTRRSVLKICKNHVDALMAAIDSLVTRIDNYENFEDEGTV